VWVRFEEAELPAEQAVAVTSEPALLTVGGAALGAFALIAGAAVLIVYMADSQGTRAGQSALVLLLAGSARPKPPVRSIEDHVCIVSEGASRRRTSSVPGPGAPSFCS
jgi:hypothetical protein